MAKLSKEQMIALHGAMVAPPHGEPGTSGRNMWLGFAEEGWAQSWQVEDFFLITDRRLGPYQHGVDLTELGDAIGCRQVSICLRPKAHTGWVSLNDAWPAMDFAGLLIFLEKLGFAVDPRPLVDTLVPMIPKRGFISHAALDVLWYGRQREKSQISIQRETAEGVPGHSTAEYTLRGGYKLYAFLDEAGEPLELTVTGPRYRRSRKPVETVCADCGWTWWRGDSDSSASHRREHKKRMSYLDPQPHPRMIEEMAGSEDPEHVDWLSPPWKHKEMYRRALAFKRELHFDFAMWTPTGEVDPNVHGFLLSTEAGAIIGACAFRLREFEGGSKAYGLQWIWVAPRHRRSGALRARWSEFRRRFGDFWIEHPVSDAMKAFVISMADEQLLKIPGRR